MSHLSLGLLVRRLDSCCHNTVPWLLLLLLEGLTGW
jgi:hypothetical protein